VGSAPFDPSWSIKPNVEFQRNHIPKAEDNQYMTPSVKESVLWAQRLANFSGSSQGYRIDKFSVAPKDFLLD
jgi:hypothetical protein